MSNETKEFATKEEAMEWMDTEVDDPCTDNYRFAYVGDTLEMAKYEKAITGGCCGSFDKYIIVDGKAAMIGCNYGH